jgi:hypothetical protein
VSNSMRPEIAVRRASKGLNRIFIALLHPNGSSY